MGYDMVFWFVMIGCICIGSFLNVVIHRLPVMINDIWESDTTEQKQFNLSWPGSHCPTCGHELSWKDNIPIVSWLLLRGKCRYCGEPISVRYLVVEMLAGLWGVFAWTYSTDFYVFGSLFAFGAVLLALTIIDFETYLLPDDLTYPLMWGGLLASLNSWGVVSVAESLYGAAAGYALLYSIAKIFEKYSGKEGMGHGDFKLYAALGAWLGIKALPMILLVACCFTLILALFFRAGKDNALPFGPGLCFSGYILIVYAKVWI